VRFDYLIELWVIFEEIVTVERGKRYLIKMNELASCLSGGGGGGGIFFFLVKKRIKNEM